MSATRDANEFIPTRQTLLSRLKDWNDHDSWKDFFDTYWKLIYSTAIKSGLTDAEAQEVVQETILSVSKAMPGFQYDPALGSFKTWLMRLTRWRIADQLRKRKPGGLSGPRLETARTDIIERIPDPAAPFPDQLWDEDWEKNIMDTAIERVKARVDPKQYQIFDLYVLQNWPVKKITNLLKVHAGWVYLVKHRIAASIKKEIRRLRTKMP